MILRYAITDPKYYGTSANELKESVKRVLDSKEVDMICLRDKKSKNYEALAEAFLSLKPSFKDTLFLLHTELELARRLEADAIHLSSDMIGSVEAAARSGVRVIVSTHSLEEAKVCEAAGAYGVTYGPIFNTPGKGAPKGLEKLKEITGKISINIFALGGITGNEEIEAVERAGAAGFASIRYFVD
ncbi:MAG: thiamine phosphate synthase [Hydrogenimonas sp.]|nr:thiamine phosphate synthase [Hydrogenimonas sp.]